MPGMVRVAGQNGASAVKLLCKDEPGQSMSERERAQRQQKLGAWPCSIGPAARRTNGEDHMLQALLAMCAEPCGEGLGAHAAATRIKQYRDDRSAAVLAIHPL